MEDEPRDPELLTCILQYLIRDQQRKSNAMGVQGGAKECDCMGDQDTDRVDSYGMQP